MKAAGEDLDGDIATEFGVARPIHLTHPARAEPSQDVIVAEPLTEERVRRITDHDRARRHGRGRLSEKAFAQRAGLRQERLHLATQVIISRTGGREIG